jgi:hypothetical protein
MTSIFLFQQINTKRVGEAKLSIYS